MSLNEKVNALEEQNALMTDSLLTITKQLNELQTGLDTIHKGMHINAHLIGFLFTEFGLSRNKINSLVQKAYKSSCESIEEIKELKQLWDISDQDKNE